MLLPTGVKGEVMKVSVWRSGKAPPMDEPEIYEGVKRTCVVGDKVLSLYIKPEEGRKLIEVNFNWDQVFLVEKELEEEDG